MKPKRRLKKKVKEFLCLMLCSSLFILLAVLTIDSVTEEKTQVQEIPVFSDKIEQEIIPKVPGQLVVVIDPVYGTGNQGISTKEGYRESDFTLQIAGLLQEKISESDIKVYFTRTDDKEVSEEEKLQFVQETDADLYLQIGVSADEDTAKYGIQGYYNEKYVIPEFGNAQWADMVVQKVTFSASNRAISLEDAAADSILRHLEIPAAQVNLGFFSNSQEALLMQQEEYQHKLAQGIADAIYEVYIEKKVIG